ncbi:UDP-N-acetylglucosamine 2-epimerase (non-hydrolysing), partial [Fervidobacterium changbaicum]
RELVETGWNILADGEGIYDAVFSTEEKPYPTEVYGNGDAGKRIVEILAR